MVEAARRHGAGRVVDLSDEPVLDERDAVPADRPRARGRPRVLGRRLRVPAAAAARRRRSRARRGGDGEADREDRRQRPRGPSAARRTAGSSSSRWAGAARPMPEVVDGAGGTRSASPICSPAPAPARTPPRTYLEDAALAGVVTVGARRCGSGARRDAVSVERRSRPSPLARALDPDLVAPRGVGRGPSAGGGGPHGAGNVGRSSGGRPGDRARPLPGTCVRHGRRDHVRAAARLAGQDVEDRARGGRGAAARRCRSSRPSFGRTRPSRWPASGSRSSRRRPAPCIPALASLARGRPRRRCRLRSWGRCPTAPRLRADLDRPDVARRRAPT